MPQDRHHPQALEAGATDRDLPVERFCPTGDEWVGENREKKTTVPKLPVTKSNTIDCPLENFCPLVRRCFASLQSVSRQSHPPSLALHPNPYLSLLSLRRAASR